MEATRAHLSRERSAGRPIWAAALVAVLWASGTAVTVAPVLASFFTVNRSPVFWPALTIATVGGAAIGFFANLNPSTPLAQRLGQLPAPMLVAVGYPMSLGVGLAIENVDSWSSGSLTMLALALAGAVILAAACRWAPWWPPGTALRSVSWVWVLLSILLFPVLGLGLILVPLAVAYRWAARHVERMSDDLRS